MNRFELLNLVEIGMRDRDIVVASDHVAERAQPLVNAFDLMK